MENNKNIKFNLYFSNIDLESVNVIADRNRIAQVITNLIDNAIKFISKENEKDVIDGIINIMVKKSKNIQ